MKSNKAEKLRYLFGEKAKFLEGKKTKRMHIYVDPKSAEEIEKGCARYSISISKYVLYAALNFDLSNVAENLSLILAEINKHMQNAGVTCEITNKGVKTMTEINKNNTISTANEERSEQLHLRVTPEAHDEIKRRAMALSMSISDYIVFTTTHFDIMDIAKKVDEINQKLDALEKNQGI